MEALKTDARAPRISLHVDVEFRRNYAREVTHGTLKNISLTGAFFQHDGVRLQINEKLSLTFKVNGRERVIHGMVVWRNSTGYGMKFLPANNRDVQIVDDLIDYIESKRTDTREILNKIFEKVS